MFSSSMSGARPTPGLDDGLPHTVQVVFMDSPNTRVPQSATSLGDCQVLHNEPSQSGMADLFVTGLPLDILKPAVKTPPSTLIGY